MCGEMMDGWKHVWIEMERINEWTIDWEMDRKVDGKVDGWVDGWIIYG